MIQKTVERVAALGPLISLITAAILALTMMLLNRGFDAIVGIERRLDEHDLRITVLETKDEIRNNHHPPQ